MTPDQIDLSRAAMALPGWRIRRADGQLRDAHGIKWVASDPIDFQRGGSGHPVPDITDAATGGVLVAMLGFDAHHLRPTASMHKYNAGMRWRYADDEDGISLWASTLGISACHIAIAVGRWEGGS